MQRHLPCAVNPAHTMNYLGKGTTPGTHHYLCLACGQQDGRHELWEARVTSVTRWGVQVTIGAQPFLGAVDADATSIQGGSLRVGDRVLVCIGKRSTGRPYARAVYPIGGRDAQPPPSPRRERGVIAELRAPDWGWVIDHKSKTRLFIHQRACVGPIFRPGQRVSYVRTYVPGRGWQATDVRAL